MDTTVLLWVLAASLILTGLAGIALPLLPGAPLLFLGLLVGAWADNFHYVGYGTLAVLAGLTVLTYIIDFLAGILGAKRFGASPRAMVGAGIGALLGLFMGLPGILFGPVVAGLCWASVLYFGFTERGPAYIELLMFALGVCVAVAWAALMILWILGAVNAPWPLHWQTNIIDPRRVT